MQHSQRSHAQQQELATLLLLGGAMLIAALAATIPWVLALVAGWLHTGQLPALSLGDALKVAVSPDFWSGDPASAYPPPVAQQLPGGAGFWTSSALLVALVAAAVTAVGREIDARMGQAIADRRWYHLLRGRKPQPFGRYRSVRPLLVSEPCDDRVILGTIARPSSLLAAAPNVQICAVAAPRSGKTSGLVIPALLEHPGPAVTTSVRTDVVNATIARRRQLGQTWIWDPFGADTCSWDPLHGCEDWGHALLVARWLSTALQLGDGSSNEYFGEAAQEFASPLLHAAALGDHTIVDVYQWARDQKIQPAIDILTTAGHEDAIARLQSVMALNARQRDGVTGTLQVQLRAYGHPSAARTAARHAEGLTPERLFDGGANTLYVVAGREHQQTLAPLVITMLSSLLYHVAEHENRVGALSPRSLWLLDELASIAPLRALPQILATSLPSVRFLTVWHSVAQIRERYGPDGAATILALSQAKVFLGSITDDHTRNELVRLLGQTPTTLNGTEQWRDTLTAQALQRLQDGRSLLVHGELPPVFLEQRRYYADPDLRRLAGDQTVVSS